MAETSPSSGPALRPGVLYLSVAVVAVCGIVYELIIGAASSYMMGDSVWQFSVTIGLFMSAMGIGSFLSARVTRGLFATFVAAELAIALLGGTSALTLFWGFTQGGELYPFLQYGLTLAIGALVGLEVPLLLRLLENRHELRYNAAYVLGLDYMGGLVGSLAFPLLLLPHLGLVRAALLIGLLNALVAVLGLARYARRFMRRRRALGFASLASLGVLVTGLVAAPELETALEQRLYRDPIVSSTQTPYQHLTLTRDGPDMRLFINGNLQYSSLDEHRYHEALVHVPIARLSAAPRRVLVLGGGDGLALRELLKYPQLQQADLVDLDPAILKLHREEPALVALNGGSLSDRRVAVHAEDALKFLLRSRASYDLVLVDLPDPNAEALTKLYTREFYQLVASRLRPHGAIAVQASSPYFAREAYWCIAKTVGAAGLAVKTYHLDVPSFGDWGFVLGSPRKLPEKPWRFDVPTRYLTAELAPGLFKFGRDEDGAIMDALEVHSTFKPVLHRYYQKGWATE